MQWDPKGQEGKEGKSTGGGNECQLVSDPDYYSSLQFMTILYFAGILVAVHNNLNIFQINAGKTES